MIAKPWQRRSARPARPDVAVRGELPTIELRIYDHAILLTRRRGPVWTTYPVDPAALAQAFTTTAQASGLLPWGTIATGQLYGHPFFVQYIPPRPISLTITRAHGQHSRAFQTPGLVWAGWTHDYRIWALAGPASPDRLDIPLCAAPFPNCYADGTICWGSVDEQGAATAATLGPTLDVFLRDSAFNDHLANGKSRRHPQSIVALYAELDVDAPYPVNDLVPATVTLEQVVTGRIWGAS